MIVTRQFCGLPALSSSLSHPYSVFRAGVHHFDVKSHSARAKKIIKPKPIQMSILALPVLVFIRFLSLPPILPFSPLFFKLEDL
jgi:hypothetical protein